MTAEDFWKHGYVVVPGLCQSSVVLWRDLYRELRAEQRKVNRWNPVEVKGPFPAPLSDMPRHPAILDVVEKLIGPNICLYNFRFVVKDQHSRAAVPLHQDCSYHAGFMVKLSAFVALSHANPENGALEFIPGTHKWGHMGDAGQLRLPGGFFGVQQQSLHPGDAVFMHSSLWHRSPAWTKGEDRVLADIHYQPANDPTGIELVRGEWKTEYRMPPERRAELFERSRSDRLRELQDENDRLRGEVAELRRRAV